MMKLRKISLIALLALFGFQVVANDIVISDPSSSGMIEEGASPTPTVETSKDQATSTEPPVVIEDESEGEDVFEEGDDLAE